MSNRELIFQRQFKKLPACKLIFAGFDKYRNIFVFKNDCCEIGIKIIDNFSIEFFLYNPKDPSKKEYEVFFYRKYILIDNVSEGVSRRNRRYNIDNEEHVLELLKLVCSQVVEKLERPLKGDFSWMDLYHEKVNSFYRIMAYIESTTYEHSEERKALVKLATERPPGWEKVISDYMNREAK